MRRVAVMFTLVACATAPAEIPKDELALWTADVICRRTQECMQGVFDSAYYGLDDCRASIERDYDRVVEAMDDSECDYSANRAGAAYVEIDEMSCEEYYEGDANESLGEIWTDCGATYTYTYTTYYGYQR